MRFNDTSQNVYCANLPQRSFALLRKESILMGSKLDTSHGYFLQVPVSFVTLPVQSVGSSDLLLLMSLCFLLPFLEEKMFRM